MAPDALPSSLERGLRKVGLGKGRYEVWRCAFSPRMAVRERPEAKAQIVATLQKDQHFIADVKKAKGGTWLVFGAPELWGCRCNNKKAYVCIEGDSVGHPNLGTLVERVGGDEDLALLKSHWAYTESILRVEEAGVDWHVEPCPVAGPGPDAVHHEHGQVGADGRDEAEDAEEERHHRNGAAF